MNRNDTLGVDAVRISKRCWAIMRWSLPHQNGREYWRGGDPHESHSWIMAQTRNSARQFQSRPKALAAYAEASLISQL